MKNITTFISILLLNVSYNYGQVPSLVKDINITGDASPTNFYNFNNKLYFSASGSEDNELWVSDGTNAGTNLLKDINPTGSSFPGNFCEFNGKLYFSATDSNGDTELWVTDGTSNGTILLKDINPTGASYPSNLFVYNNKLYFNARKDDTGIEVFVSDGTSAGTDLFIDLVPGTANSIPYNFMEANGTLYFVAMNSTYEMNIYKSDGTANGTSTLLNPDAPNGVNPMSMIVFNNEIYFSGNSNTYGRELFKTDGTTITLVKDIQAGNLDSSPSDFFIHNNLLYFKANDGTSMNYFKTDGTAAGTIAVTDLTNAQVLKSHFIDNNKLYYLYTDDVNHDDHLYVVDLTNLSNSNYTNLTSDFTLQNFKTINGVHYLTASTNSTGSGLYRINDLANFIVDTIETNGQIYDSFLNMSELFEFNQKIFASGKFDQMYGHELYQVTDLTVNTAQISDINLKIYPNPSSDLIQLESSNEFAYSTYTIDGKLIHQEHEKQSAHQLDIKAYPTGYYLIKIQDSEKTFRFIKK